MYTEPSGPLTWRDNFLFCISPRSRLARFCRRIVMQPLYECTVLAPRFWFRAMSRLMRCQRPTKREDQRVQLVLTFEKIVRRVWWFTTCVLSALVGGDVSNRKLWNGCDGNVVTSPDHDFHSVEQRHTRC